MIMITEIIPFYFVVDHKFTKIFTLKHLELPDVPQGDLENISELEKRCDEGKGGIKSGSAIEQFSR